MADQPTAKLLIAEPPLQVLPSLAVRLGLPEAIFVQQLHYMLINPKLGKMIDGAKWIRNSLQEWHEIFPFWAVNTIRDILERLTSGKVLRICVPSGRCAWYTLDYETLGTANLKSAKPKTSDDPSFGQSMKKYRKSKHDPETGQSMIQKLDASKTSAKTSPDNSSELGVPNSTELARSSSDADISLNPAEREILRACNDGVVIAHYHNAEAANHLIALGMIERCQCGAKDVLCLKGKCPTRDKPCDDVKVTELQTALQQSFLPGSDGSITETVVTPSPQTPLPPPAPAALPEVPVGFTVRWSYDILSITEGQPKCASTRHYIPDGMKRSLCGLYPKYDKPDSDLYADNTLVHPPVQCPDCAAKAAARARGKGKAPKKVKPAIYSDDALFEAVAAFCFKVTEKADFKAIGGRVAKIRLALCDYVIEKLGREPTPDETAKVVERVKALPAWYDNACKKCDRPQSPDTFMTWYLRYLQSLNGTAQAEGDAQWFDAPNGRWLKREKGLLYERDHDNQEQWNRVER